MEMNYPKHNSGHNDSLQLGLEFQDFVCIELSKQGIVLQNLSSKKYQYSVGENLQGFEIKYDNSIFKYNRLSIEIAEKVNGDNLQWAKSGIYRKDNSWLYIQGNYKLFYIFSKDFLIRLHLSKTYEESEFPYDNPTIRKFYLPFSDCDKYAIKKFDFMRLTDPTT